MKIGFDTSNESDQAEEPEVGHADSTTEEEPSYWWDTAYPMLIDFAICYGAFSVVRDLIKACRGGNHADV